MSPLLAICLIWNYFLFCFSMNSVLFELFPLSFSRVCIFLLKKIIILTIIITIIILQYFSFFFLFIEAQRQSLTITFFYFPVSPCSPSPWFTFFILWLVTRMIKPLNERKMWYHLLAVWQNSHNKIKTTNELKKKKKKSWCDTFCFGLWHHMGWPCFLHNRRQNFNNFYRTRKY